MARYQLLIEYVGTNFRGWQIQKTGLTVQGLIQKNLKKLLNEKIVVIGSGRTDSGVHAIEQSAHFDCKKKIRNLESFAKSINHFLNPKDVAIIKACVKKYHVILATISFITTKLYIDLVLFSHPGLNIFAFANLLNSKSKLLSYLTTVGESGCNSLINMDGSLYILFIVGDVLVVFGFCAKSQCF